MHRNAIDICIYIYIYVHVCMYNAVSLMAIYIYADLFIDSLSENYVCCHNVLSVVEVSRAQKQILHTKLCLCHPPSGRLFDMSLTCLYKWFRDSVCYVIKLCCTM